MILNFWGNLYFENIVVKFLGDMVDDIRMKIFDFFGVDLKYFDFVFVVNVIVGIKLVVDVF